MASRPSPVLLMTRSLGAGGSERQLTEAAKFLDRRLFSPHVACVDASGIRCQELREWGVPVLELPMHSFLGRDACRAAARLHRYLRENRIRIVHPFDFTLNIFGVPLARFFRTPVVISSQRCFWDLIPPRYRPPMRFAHRIATAVTVNCEALRKEVVERLAIERSRVRVCSNALDTSVYHYQPRSRPAQLKDASLVIGVTCVLRPEKGLSTLLDAFARLYPANPGLRLVVVGSGPLLDSLKRQALQLGIGSACLFEPATADVLAWLRAIDIFALPSLSEALSNSLMEAMACGCCAVASRVGGNPELVFHGGTGLLFEPGNSGDLAEQLRAVVEDATLREDLARAGAASIAANYSIPVSIGRLQHIYESLLRYPESDTRR
jgi:glycosyltransferase involved in cell wall biosynthesis